MSSARRLRILVNPAAGGTPSSTLLFIRGMPKVFRGTHIHEPNVHVWRARRVLLDADRPLPVYADGEELARTPAG